MVQWVSAATSDPSSVIYGVTSDDLNIMANGSAVAYSFEGYTSGGIHNAVLPTLKTDTLYYYQVGGAGQYSTTFNFKTAPEEGKAGVKFGIIGDVGADPNSEETIKGLINIRKNIGLDLVLHAGDLSYANNYNPGGPVWDHYGEIMQPLLAYTPY